MQNCYLLFIDILGFTKLSKNNPQKVKEIYKIINALNAHKHNAFKTIVFSDTILVYSKEIRGGDDHRYLIMYLIEFAQDLLYKTIGKDIYFRAFLTHGEFEHYYLDNVECFFGEALIRSSINHPLGGWSQLC